MTMRIPEGLTGASEEAYREHLDTQREQAAKRERRNRIAARKAPPKPKPRQVKHPLETPLQKAATAKPTPIRAHVYNLDRAANPPPSLKNELKEMGLDMVPIWGTYRSAKALADEWKVLSVAQKTSGVVLTGLSAVGDIFIVVGGLKAGAAVIKVSARTASKSPGLVAKVLKGERGAVALGKADDITVISASGRSSSGGLSARLQNELNETLRAKGYGTGATRKFPGRTGTTTKPTGTIKETPGARSARTGEPYAGPTSTKKPGGRVGTTTKPTGMIAETTRARAIRLDGPIAGRLGFPAGDFIATGTAANTAAVLISGYPKADPEQKARIITQVQEQIKTGTVVVTAKPVTDTATRTQLQTKPVTDTTVTTKPRTDTEGETIRTIDKTTTTRPARPKGKPSPRQPSKPTGKPAPPRPFMVKGRALPEGQYPRVVSWQQGFVRWHLDLDTGKRKPSRVLGATRRVDPWKTFRVETTDTTPPKDQIIDLGMVDVSVTEKGIGRFRAQSMRDRSTTSRRGKP